MLATASIPLLSPPSILPGEFSFIVNASGGAAKVWAATSPDRWDTAMSEVIEIKEHQCCDQVAGAASVSWEKGKNYYVKAIMMTSDDGDTLEFDDLQVGIAFNGTQQMPVPLAYDVIGGPHCPVTPSNPDANGGVCGPGDSRFY